MSDPAELPAFGSGTAQPDGTSGLPIFASPPPTETEVDPASDLWLTADGTITRDPTQAARPSDRRAEPERAAQKRTQKRTQKPTQKPAPSAIAEPVSHTEARTSPKPWQNAVAIILGLVVVVAVIVEIVLSN